MRVAALCGAASLGVIPVAATDASAALAPPVGNPALSSGCALSVTFPSDNMTVNPSAISSTTVVKVPQSDDVAWSGSLSAGSPGSSHTSSGAVVVKLPIGSVSVKTWSEPFGPASDSGHVSYNFPSVLDNVELHVSGHEDDNGSSICTGAGIIEVSAGTFKNPLSYGSIAGLVVFTPILLFSGRKRLI